MALPLARTYDFTAGTKILSSQVDEELNNILTELNLLPEKDSTLQTNLNADLLDSLHASTTGGTDTIPVCNGVLQVDLNADLLDGLNATDISAAAFDAGTKLVFYQATPPTGWTIETAPTDHVLTWKSGETGGTDDANSWAISGVAVTVDDTELLPAHMPVHTHAISYDLDIPLYDGGVTNPTLHNVQHTNDTTTSSFETIAISETTGTSGNGTAHGHTASSLGDATWRPPASYVIIASKD